MKKPPKMEINHPTASHLPALEHAVLGVDEDALVIEHGAGLYSTPLFARDGHRVLCVESHEGWREWARWMYRGRAEFVDFATLIKARLCSSASLVFIDGPADERGPLLSACIEASVSAIIAHDTGIKTRDYYGYKPHHFTAERYEVTHPVDRTTVWKLKPPS